MVFCLTVSPSLPACAPTLSAECRGKGRRGGSSKVGVWERIREGQKVLLRLQASLVNSWPLEAEAKAAKAAAAAPEDWHRVLGVCLGDSAR